MKIWWACPVDAAVRHAQLAEFAEAHRLGDEARFWRRSLAALPERRAPKPSE